MYKLYKDGDLEFLKNNCSGSKEIISFNMKKLELEYDYDTDEEQLFAAKRMLTKENVDRRGRIFCQGRPTWPAYSSG